MFEEAQGLVLRTRRLTESSLIVSWLANCGRVSTVAKGALRPKSPFRGKLDLFYLCEFTFSRSRRSELHTLREVRLIQAHPFLRADLPALQQVSYCANLVEQTTEPDTPLPGMFEMLLGFLQSLEARRPDGQQDMGRVLAFELRLLSDLGLAPEWEDRSRPEVRAAVESLLSAQWKEIPDLPIAEPALRELSRILHGFLIYHFGRLARGREAAVRAGIEPG